MRLFTNPLWALWLLLLLSVTGAFDLAWQEYARLAVIAIGLGYFSWRLSTSLTAAGVQGRTGSMLLAFVFMFAVTQFDSQEAAPSLDWKQIVSTVLIVLVGTAFVILAWSSKFWKNGLTQYDWIVIVAVLLVLLFMVAAGLTHHAFDWGIVPKLIIYLMFWFLFTRSLIGGQKQLLWGAVAVFAVICLVGSVQTGAAFYHFFAGGSAMKKGELIAAEGYYTRSEGLSSRLAIKRIKDASSFAIAEIYLKQGHEKAAAEKLGMEAGFTKLIRTEAWMGPAGGELYTHISCWEDLDLYAGQIELQIYARGQAALDIWPTMEVKLGGQVLGEVNVTSSTRRAYTFTTPVETGAQRLEIAFKNDYYQPPEDRNLWVEQAEIRYLEIFWR